MFLATFTYYDVKYTEFGISMSSKKNGSVDFIIYAAVGEVDKLHSNCNKNIVCEVPRK